MTTRATSLRLASAPSAPVLQVAKAACIQARNRLAQILISRAWQRSLAGARPAKPWPWAEMFPIARLEAPRHGAALIVLAGARGRTLAAGPGHVEGTPLPGAGGNAVISGDRRTHFAFLRDLRSGDTLFVHAASGARIRYVVSGIEVVRYRNIRVLLDAGDDRLTLVTCYPFDSAVPGGALRYVVVAKRAELAVARL